MVQMKRMAESRSQGFRVYYHDKVDLLQLFLIASELPKAAVNSFAGLRRFFFYIPTRFTHFTTFVVDVCLVKTESSSTISSKLLFVKRNACSTEQQ
jgi:hypothetical protein